MELLEKLMIKKIELLNRIRNTDAKTQKTHDKRIAPLKEKLAKLDAEIKSRIYRQRQVLDGIHSIDSRINHTKQFYGEESASHRVEDWALETRPLPNKEVEKYVLTVMKQDLERIMEFNRLYEVKGEYDANKLRQVNEKLAQL